VEEKVMDAVGLIVAGPAILIAIAEMDTVPVKQTMRTAIAVLRIASAVNNPKEIARTASRGGVTGNAIRTKMDRTVRTARRTLSSTVVVMVCARGMRITSIARSIVDHRRGFVGTATATPPTVRTVATAGSIVVRLLTLPRAKLTARMVSTMTVTAIPTVKTQTVMVIQPAPVGQSESRVRRTATVAPIGATEEPASSDRR